MLAVLRHLNYQPWYALGEFVDNSVQSAIQNHDQLVQLHGNAYRLKVDIDIESSPTGRISIRDNAAGIAQADYARAFRPAALPPDRTGLSEFGMGMKSAACWFAPRWSVRTSALREPFSRTVIFDIADIVEDDIEELTILETTESPLSHFTEVVLEDVFHPPVGRTVGKLKEHLSDIYRQFIRDGELELIFNGEPLSYSPPTILTAPYFKTPDDPPVQWRKDIEFDFGDGLRVSGFAALRETANTAKAGFALFRRGRVIQGSGDDGYRPSEIFGASNSYKYQRLFGELHLDGFEVSHTKDGFRWDENEQPFLDLLREHLDSPDLPLLRQAEGFRARLSRDQVLRTAEVAVTNATQALAQRLPTVLPVVACSSPVSTPPIEPANIHSLARRSFEIEFREETWLVSVDLTDDPAESRWCVVGEDPRPSDSRRMLDVRVSLAHPFMVRFAQNDPTDVEALLRVAVALGVGEIGARMSGVATAGSVRRNVNELLLNALSQA